MLTITLQQTANGIVVTRTWQTDTDAEEIVYSFEDTDNDNQHLARMCSHLVDWLGDGGSRYDSNRIYIVNYPGDKNALFGTVECPLCFHNPNE
jgi:hypothetical protein